MKVELRLPAPSSIPSHRANTSLNAQVVLKRMKSRVEPVGGDNRAESILAGGKLDLNLSRRRAGACRIPCCLAWRVLSSWA